MFCWTIYSRDTRPKLLALRERLEVTIAVQKSTITILPDEPANKRIKLKTLLKKGNRMLSRMKWTVLHRQLRSYHLYIQIHCQRMVYCWQRFHCQSSQGLILCTPNLTLKHFHPRFSGIISIAGLSASLLLSDEGFQPSHAHSSSLFAIEFHAEKLSCNRRCCCNDESIW